MDRDHLDWLLGGSWTCDLEGEEAYPAEMVDEMHALIDDLIDDLE